MVRLFILFFLLLPAALFAQLPDFTVSVATTDETCLGNGTMTFTVNNATPGSTVLFAVYSLPTMTQVISTSELTVVGLESGTYVVDALQTLGSESNTFSIQVVIDQNTPVPLEFDADFASTGCTSGNQMTVNVLEGTGSLYEIVSGPVTAPPQTSNVFTGLVDGTYNVKVYDECGDGFVRTFTVFFSAQSPVVTSPAVDQVLSGDCSTVVLQNTISYPEGTIISYPLTLVYTIHPSNGDPDIVYNQTINDGDNTTVEFSNTLPYIEGVTYNYDISITNGCGQVFTNSGSSFSALPTVALNKNLIPCGNYYLTLIANNYNPPYTVNFTSVPDGFDPVAFNSAYPGPYTTSPQNFGSDSMAVPEGTYVVTITDACNRTSEPFQIEIEKLVVVPVTVGRNNGCFSDHGWISITIPDRKIVSAIIISAPAAYPNALPFNVSSFIDNNGKLTVTNLPLGTYVFTLIDDCGDVYENVTVTVPVFVPREFAASSVPDCDEGLGSVTVNSNNGKLVSLSIITAPAGFTQPLPFDVTAFIETSSGKMYMSGLPEGTYTFSGIDICGISDDVAVTINGYHPDATPYTFLPQCNSFDISMEDTNVSGITATYWLQRRISTNPDVWGHADTGVAYTDGTLPTATNSYSLANGQVNYNLQFYGVFRIVKAFQSTGNGASAKLCTEILGDTFEYYYDVTINNVYSVSCSDSPNNVYVDATGLAPLHYYAYNSVTNALVVDNGNNSIFVNLPTGTYKFVVENACLASRSFVSDITNLPDLVNAGTPVNMSQCVEPGVSLFQPFDLTQQNIAVLNGGAADAYNIVYYLSEADAENQVNPIPDPTNYVNTSNPQTIYVRMNHVFVQLCPDISPFGIEVATRPILEVDEEQFLCQQTGYLTLTAGDGFDEYLWSPGGQITPSITVEEGGDYTVTVTNYTSLNQCSTSATITVIPVDPPVIRDIQLMDWTEDNNSITIIMDIPYNYEYSIDGINYQDDNVFSDLPTGIYDIFVRDKQQCGTVQRKVSLVYYPKFFTPNGDGYHETWYIHYSWLEPDMVINIFDRYGKLIYSFGPNSSGWDGTFHGQPLPATDYWFMIQRHDGRVHRGHFSLLR
ncbi:T9SS type B sorting domain-containing protein [Flavobacterium sp. RHBU_3]|uniref:T9SS type B sorting domain-containing protein n=1 Tax=Flavobacterium sp. RHBU_3 TaxID=3391184 RepID=UPI0039850C0F